MSELQVAPGGDLGEVAYLRAPAGPERFRRRAQRLAALAPGHAAGDYLAFLALVCEAQAAAAGATRLSPNGRDLPPGRPLDVAAPPPAEWRAALSSILASLEPAAMPGPAREALRQLAAAGAGPLDELAGRVLSGELGADELARAPLVGAALQVPYVLLAAGVGAMPVARAGDAGCPVCGFGPVAGLLLAGDRLRYLSCGLCASEWHLTRLQCAVCRQADQVAYLAVEGGDGVARAEACHRCRAYTKILDVEKAPRLEPAADDLATLSLDLLVAEQGFARTGRNLLLATAGGAS